MRTTVLQNNVGHVYKVSEIQSIMVSGDADLYLPALMMKLDSTIGEVMSSPAVTLTLEKTVLGNFCFPLLYSLRLFNI